MFGEYPRDEHWECMSVTEIVTVLQNAVKSRPVLASILALTLASWFIVDWHIYKEGVKHISSQPGGKTTNTLPNSHREECSPRIWNR